MKKIIFWITLILSTLAIQTFMTYEECYHDYSYLRYCKVIDKVDYVKTTKHKSNYSSSPERALIVQWNDTKEIYEQGVVADTYYTTNIGQTVVFTKEHKAWKYEHPFIGLVFFAISIFAYLGEVMLLGWCVYWLISYYIFDKNILE